MKKHSLWILIVIFSIIIIFLFAKFIPPIIHERLVRSLIAEHEDKPTQETTNRLIMLLDKQQVTPEQGEQILKLIFSPRLSVRDSYRAGKTIYFKLQHPFDILFYKMSVKHEYDVNYPENHHGGASDGCNHYGTKPSIDKIGSMKTGIHKVLVTYKYKLTPLRTERIGTWPFGRTREYRDKKDEPVYECKIEIVFEVNVVEEEKAEEIDLVSYPTLDRNMKAAFIDRPDTGVGGYNTSSGGREIKGGVIIEYLNLPASFAFKTIFRNNEGAEIEFEDNKHNYIGHKGSSGEIRLFYGSIGLDKPGIHKGELILRTDKEKAYRDPDIKTIWDGELEFPVTLRVEKER